MACRPPVKGVGPSARKKSVLGNKHSSGLCLLPDCLAMELSKR